MYNILQKIILSCQSKDPSFMKYAVYIALNSLEIYDEWLLPEFEIGNNPLCEWSLQESSIILYSWRFSSSTNPREK
jgi:hypothetical protein